MLHTLIGSMSFGTYMATLLEKAKLISVPERTYALEEVFTKEHFDLIKAYLDDEITVRQASFALGKKFPGNFSHLMGVIIKRFYKEKKLKLEWIEN